MNAFPWPVDRKFAAAKETISSRETADWRESQSRLPILEALARYQGATRFHMPGHRGGTGADPLGVSFLGLNLYRNDVTGVPGMDDLHEPQGAILEAQELAAQAFGADQTFFSVNGTSGAIHTMVLASLNRDDLLIIPRNIHKAVLAAVILAGAKPAFVMPAFDRFLGFALGVTAESMQACIKANPDAKAALLVNPTYYGTAVDLGQIAGLLHENSMALLVDEAHGPHFRFHPALPEPALDSGADAVAQGAHKIVGALTQSSLLHIKGDLIDKARLKASFQYLTTTSPSYILMASLDLARRQMALHGKDLLDYALHLSRYLRDSVNDIPGLYAFGDEALGRPGAEKLDPTKVTITVRELGITGFQAETYLRSRFGVQVEMADLYNVLVIVSYGNTSDDVGRLLTGLRSMVVAASAGEIPKTLLSAHLHLPELPKQPLMAMSPREAAERPWEKVPLAQCRDRISSEVVTVYPPGIPILFPGEAVGGETLDYLDIVKGLSLGVSGPEDRTLSALRVVKEG